MGKKIPPYIIKTNKINKILVFSFIFSFIIILFFFIFLNSIISSIVVKKGEIIVPDITGKTLLEGLDILSEKNLGLKKEGVQYSENIPPNTIIKQIPKRGMNTRPGRMIRVIVSYGGQFVFVPNLINLPVRTAEIEIRKSGLSLGEESTMYSYTVTEGMVLAQEPVAGTSVDKTNLINLVISIGNPPPGTILMPNFVGKNIKEAEMWINKNGRKIDEKNIITSPYLDDGTIMKQTPTPDTILDPESKIIFLITVKEPTPETNMTPQETNVEEKNK